MIFDVVDKRVAMSRGRLSHLLCLLLLMLAAGNGADAREVQVAERVFVVRDRPGTPVEFQMIVNAGAADEPGGTIRGIAHYLEHLVLVGRNPEHGNSAFRFFPEAITNGWTNQIATVYWHRVPQREQGPKQDLEAFFTFYAARLKAFSIPDNEAVRERNVVLQEHDSGLGNNPVARFMRRVDQASLPAHPLGQWVIGTRETIPGLTLEDARAFHRQWYKRSNVWFVVIGDVDPDLVRDIAGRALADADPAGVVARLSRQPVPLVPRRETVLAEDSQVTRVLAVHHRTVRLAETDGLTALAATALANALLGSQLPGSLAEAVEDRAKLTTTRPAIALRRIAPETYRLVLVADPRPDTDADGRKVLAAMGQYVSGLGAATFSDRNVERIRKRWQDELRTADGQPRQVFQRLIGWLADGHDPADLNRLPDIIQHLPRGEIDRLLAGLAGDGVVIDGLLSPKRGE